MAWADKTLSDSTSLAKIESEINELTSTNWDNKIATAKSMIGSRLENLITARGVNVNEKDGEILLDTVVDPDDIFALSSDFLVLHLIFKDLSTSGTSGNYEDKSKYYKMMFDEQFAVDIQRMNLDWNLDDTTDTYRTNWIQRLQR